MLGLLIYINCMGFVINLLILIGGIIGGILLMRYNYQLTQLFGHNSLAEKYLGAGGTYSMWRLLGLLVIIGSLFYVL